MPSSIRCWLAVQRQAEAWGRCCVLLATFGLGLSTPPTLAAKPLEIIDDRGVKVVLQRPPLRVISLLPSLTESVCTIGRCSSLVGVDRYSNWPTSVKQLPQMGGGLDPNIEAIVALRPDLVLVASSAKAAFRLESLGIKVAALEPKNSKEMQIAFSKVGVLLGVSNAPIIWQDLETTVAHIISKAPLQTRPKVYFEASAGPYGASGSSFIGELLHTMGVNNIVPGTLGPFPKINPEFVVRANPDVIMIGSSEKNDLMTRPGWANIAAIKHQRVCVFSPEQGDVLVRAGPRIVEAAQLLVNCLNRSWPTRTGDSQFKQAP